MRTGIGRIGAFLASTISLFGLATLPAAVESGNLPPMPKRKGRYQLGGRDRSKYGPHQGEREIARRKRQIDDGQLRVTDESDAMRSIRLAMTDIAKVKAA